MKLKEIIVVTWILTMRLLRGIWRDWLKAARTGKIGIGSMIIPGTEKSLGTQNVTSTDPDNVEHQIYYTEKTLPDGTLKVHTPTIGYSSKISKELPQNVTITLEPGNTSFAMYQENSIYDIHLILKYER